MTPPNSSFEAEREAIAREFASAPKAQQDLLALFNEQAPPPADGEVPPMPADLLDRLRGLYGSVAEQAAVEPVVAPAKAAPPVPGFMEKLRGLFAMPSFQWGGLATACLAVVLGVLLWKPSPPVVEGGGNQDTWRGNPPPVARTGALFVWIGAPADAARAAVADRVPELLDAASAEAAKDLSQKNPEAVVYALDAAAGTVSVIVNGAVQSTQPIRAGAAAGAEGLLESLRKAQRSVAP